MTERILFGEFLVQKSLIKSNDVLDLLIEQVRSQPSIAEVVYKNKLLSEAEQLQVLRLQSHTGWDYQQACVELKLWNEKLALSVTNLSAKARTPLGQLIVSRGLMSAADLTRALDEFVGVYQGAGAVAGMRDKKPPFVPALTVMIDENFEKEKSKIIPIGVVSASGAGQPSFVTIDPVLLTEFTDLLMDARLHQIERMTQTWVSRVQAGDVETVLGELRSVGREMDAIRGAARFIRAELVEQVMHLGSVMMEAIAARPEAAASTIAKAAAVSADIYRIVFKIRDVLINERSEKSIWMSSDSRKSYEDTLSSLQDVMSLLVA